MDANLLIVLVCFFHVSYFLYFVFISFVINRLCDEGINGKDQRAEKILLSLAPPAEAKIEDRWWQSSVKAHHLTVRAERDYHGKVEEKSNLLSAMIIKMPAH